MPDINRAQFKSYCRKIKVSFKSKLEDASRQYKNMNIKILDFFSWWAFACFNRRQTFVIGYKELSVVFYLISFKMPIVVYDPLGSLNPITDLLLIGNICLI